MLLLVPRSCLTLCDPMDVAPLSMGFPRQEYWNGLPFPPPVSPISRSGEVDSGSLNLGGERHCGHVS